MTSHLGCVAPFMGLLSAPSSLSVVNGAPPPAGHEAAFVFPSGRPAVTPPSPHIFYPAWGLPRAPKPERLNPLRIEDSPGSVKNRFLALGDIEWTRPLRSPSPTSVLEGEIVHIGALSVSFLSAAQFLNAFDPSKVNFPWSRHVDILLVGGLMNTEDLNRAVEVYLQLPTPWVLFYQSEDFRAHAFRGKFHQHLFVGLDIRKNCDFRIDLEPTAIGNPQLRAKASSARIIPFTTNIDRYERIATLLWLKLAGDVRWEIEDLLRDRPTTVNRRDKANSALEAAVATASKYLAYLERSHGKNRDEARTMLSLLWSNLAGSSEAELGLSALAFERLLDLSFKRGVVSEHPYR